MAVKEWNDEIIFVRQVTPGASERSFGIQVARLAGLPDSVVGRAKEILSGLETGVSAVSISESSNNSSSQEKTLMNKSSENYKDMEGPSELDNSSNSKKKKQRSDPSQLELFN